MANCSIDSGIYTLPCASIGSVSEVYIGTYTAANKYTYTSGNTVATVLSGTPTVYAFVQDDQTASLNFVGNFNRENLAVSIQTSLSIKAYELDATKLEHFRVLSKAPVFALIKSTAGTWYIAGADSAGRMTEGTGGLGQLQTDLNGWVATFQWNNKNGVYKVDDAAIAAITFVTA